MTYAMGMTCMDCGGATASDGWCPSCLTVPSSGVDTLTRPVTRPPSGPPPGVHRGGGKSEISFGRFGRTMWTIFIVLLPVPVLVLTEGLAGWGLALLWWGVLTPWAMRDLWRRHKA